MIELKELCCGYGKKEVVSGVNEKIEGGSITSIVGPNGCGKSTLLETAAGLMSPISGSVIINGQDIHGMKPKKRAELVSMLSQQKNPGMLTVRALTFHGRFPYLGYPRKYTERDYDIVEKAMETAGVSDIANKSLSELSGGQQQKAYIAMMLAQDTEIVFMDEPVTFLDINYQLELMEIIKDMKKNGKTIVMIIHDLNLAMRYSDKIIAMKNGKTVCSGRTEEIYEKGIFDGIFGIRTHFSGDDGQFFFTK